MSLPWNKSLHLHVGTQAVQGTLRPAWARHKVLARSSHAIDPSNMGHDDATPLTAIDAVLSELKASAPGRDSHLNIVLTDAHIHFDVVAGDYRDASERQLQRWGRFNRADALIEMAQGPFKLAVGEGVEQAEQPGNGFVGMGVGVGGPALKQLTLRRYGERLAVETSS